MSRTKVTLLLIALQLGSFASAQTLELARATYRNIPLPRLNMSVQPRVPRTKTRWERFDAEFGIQNQRATGITGPIVRAKYGADVILFSLDTLGNSIEDALELRYSNGRVRRAMTLPAATPKRMPGLFEDARLKFDLQLASGRPYLGARLVIPIN